MVVRLESPKPPRGLWALVNTAVIEWLLRAGHTYILASLWQKLKDQIAGFWNDLQSLTECVRMEPRAHKNTRTDEEGKQLRG